MMGKGQEGLEAQWEALGARMAEDRRRQDHDRVRVVITMVSEPEPDEPASSLCVQLRATERLRGLMRRYWREYGPWASWDFCEAPANIYPQQGQQLVIEDMAFEAVLGISVAECYDGNLQQVEWLVDDFIRTLSGYYALVSWAE